MSKLVEIEAKVSKRGDSVRLGMDANDGAFLYLNAGPFGSGASTHIHAPAEARELVQMLRAAADVLLDWALQQEQPQNFAAAEVAK